MDPDLVVTFPEGKVIEARYKDYVVRVGDDERWYEGPPPSPFDLFLISIGTCAAANVYAFMTHRDIPTENARVILHRFTDPEKKMITKFSFEVVLPKEFPDKYRRAMIRVVDACAVKQHIQLPPEFETQVRLA